MLLLLHPANHDEGLDVTGDVHRMSWQRSLFQNGNQGPHRQPFCLRYQLFAGFALATILCDRKDFSGNQCPKNLLQDQAENFSKQFQSGLFERNYSMPAQISVFRYSKMGTPHRSRFLLSLLFDLQCNPHFFLRPDPCRSHFAKKPMPVKKGLRKGFEVFA